MPGEMPRAGSGETHKAAERERARVPGAPAQEAARDRDCVRRVLPRDREAEDCAVGRGAGEREEAEEERDERGCPHRVHWGLRARVHAVDGVGEGKRLVAREGKDLAGRCGKLGRRDHMIQRSAGGARSVGGRRTMLEPIKNLEMCDQDGGSTVR